MAYTAAHHAVFADRCRNAARALRDLKDELQRLDDIYTSEAASGGDPDFGDTPANTRQELINIISLNRDLAAFLSSGALSPAYRSVWINPFLL